MKRETMLNLLWAYLGTTDSSEASAIIHHVIAIVEDHDDWPELVEACLTEYSAWASTILTSWAAWKKAEVAA